ncbi:uncharacterized protein LOC113793128 [Dermatophagoides pteronyssinus]|uniref:uncharacterized protein LOC113793128 n=1 Tax=Dermatophagoides pteronyssinus TaxID=6956 RepID=UPI003F6648D3
MLISFIRIWSRQIFILLWPMILLGGGCFLNQCHAFIGEDSTPISNHHHHYLSSNIHQINHSSWPIDRYDNDGDQSTNRENINFFDQINAKNHRPSSFISPSESQSRVAIASPDDDNDYDHNYNSKHSNRLQFSAQSTNPNVYYYSPKNYGRTSNHSSSSMITSTPGSTIETQQTASHHLNTPETKSSYSSSPVMTSVDKSSKIRFESNDPSLSSSSSSSSPGKTLLIHKFYNHDLSQMTAALNKHTGNNVPEIFISSGHLNQGSTGPSKSEHSTIDQDNENVTYDDDDDESDVNVHNDQDGDDQLSPPSNVIYRHRQFPSDNDRSDSGSSSPTSIKSVYRLHKPNSSSSSPRLLRRYYTTGKSPSTSIPMAATLRHMQTSHSHPMPHYYIPSSGLSTHSHGMYDTSSLGGHHGTNHHHISLPEKSGTWLGSGLAAGILIGAIPFGIMMASMMPTLFTGAMPIVNTAAVGKRRRRRSILDDWATIVGQQQSTNSRRSISLLDHVTMDKLGVFIRRGIVDIIKLLNEQNDNFGHDMAKNNHRVPFDRNDGVQQQQQQQQSKPSYLYSDGNFNDNGNNLYMKTIAKYALAALDEPKCIKEMLCSLMADGRHARTTPWQKTLYLLIKWLPKNLERSIGLDDLFTAVRRNSCLQSYRCPITIHSLNTNHNQYNDRHPNNNQNNHHHQQRQHE